MKLAIKKIRSERGLTLQNLADMAGISRSYLNEMELGAKTINAVRMTQVARALGVDVQDLIEPEARQIAVAGRVGAGAEVPLVDVYEKGDGLYHVAAPQQLRDRHGIVAVEVEGDSMAPMYQPGHVLFYTRATHEGLLEEDVGWPCIVEDAEGQAWVKQVRRGDKPGLYHLISLNPTSETRHNQRIRWAARVIMALPGDLVERV